MIKTQLKSTLLLASSFLFLVFNSCKKDFESKSETPYEIEDFGDYKMHKFNIDKNAVSIKEENGNYFYSDCEILTPEQLNILKALHNNPSTSERATVIKNFTKLWPNGIVYYTLTGISAARGRDSIMVAMKHMESKTGVRFVLRKDEKNYIQFKDHPSKNNSPIGMIGGAQNINLYNSTTVAIVQHEIMHSLGINHEQVRPDRDRYIKYFPENVQPGSIHNFNLNSNTVGLKAFDTKSIMLYGSYAFTSNGKPTLTGIDGKTTWVHNSHAKGARISPGDIEGIQFLYQSTNMSPYVSVTKNITFISAINVTSAIDLKGANTTEGTPLLLYTLNNSKQQTWKLVSAGNGEYYITSQINANKVLGLANSKISKSSGVVIKNNNSRDQKWRIFYSGASNTGFIRIAPADNTKLVLAVDGTSGKNNTLIKLENYDSTLPANQRFRMLYHAQ